MRKTNKLEDIFANGYDLKHQNTNHKLKKHTINKLDSPKKSRNYQEVPNRQSNHERRNHNSYKLTE